MKRDFKVSFPAVTRNKRQKAKKNPTLIIIKNKHVISGGKSQSAVEWWVAYSLTE